MMVLGIIWLTLCIILGHSSNTFSTHTKSSMCGIAYSFKSNVFVLCFLALLVVFILKDN